MLPRRCGHGPMGFERAPQLSAEMVRQDATTPCTPRGWTRVPGIQRNPPTKPLGTVSTETPGGWASAMSGCVDGKGTAVAPDGRRSLVCRVSGPGIAAEGTEYRVRSMWRKNELEILQERNTGGNRWSIAGQGSSPPNHDRWSGCRRPR